ncbi:MAG TPA: helix-turn-helix domain-containing protein, partial [Polyangiaceae bacterium]|nr:helix-turn-helix domain-containing protein [Polyangiaceae bacterium]
MKSARPAKSTRQTAKPARSPGVRQPSRAPRTNEELSAHTKKALIQAGRALFGKHGFTAISADALSERARRTRGALHHHFADKAGLFAAV